jgi:nucleoside-diphosphate-sugar epimerase
MSAIVTGATGHLGPHLVAELLRLDAFEHIYVVARRSGHSAEARVRAMERIARSRLEVRGDPANRGTVVAIDAASFESGSPSTRRLREEATVVVHAAADTRFTAEYEALHEANVVSTRLMCRFAATCRRLRQFLFVSTACVAGRRTGSIAEEVADDAAGFANGYEHTKWQAERVVTGSQLPSRIARLTTCVGSHEDGYVNRLGAVHHLLRWMSRGLVPMVPGDESTPVDLISTDVAAAWLARAAARPPVGVEVCHVARGTDAIRLGDLLDALTELLNDNDRRRIQRPMIVDQKAFHAFNVMVRVSGDALFARVQASAAAVLPSLVYPKVFATENAERCWNGRLPHRPWPSLLRQVLSFCRSRDWVVTPRREVSHA